MRSSFRLLGAATLAFALMQTPAGLDLAQAQVATKQIKLTERQIEGFIAAQRKMAAAKVDAEFDAISKEYGFSGVEEHDDVEANILLLLDGIDPRTRAYTEPSGQIMRRMEEVKADRSLTDAQRKLALEELTEALKSAKPIEFPANIELVKKYYDRLQAVLQ
jgi:hypothetical protein